MKIPFIERPKVIFSENVYKVYYDDNKSGFDYFENTPYFDIDFNSKECFHMTWYFFTQEAIAYYLGLLIKTGVVDDIADDLSQLHMEFISNFSKNTDLNEVLRMISIRDSMYLLSWFIYLLEKSIDAEKPEMLEEDFQQNLLDNINCLGNFFIKNN